MGYGQVGRVSRFQALVGTKRADKWVEVAAAEYVVFLEFLVKSVAAHAVLLFVDEYREIGVVVAHALYILKHADACDIVKGFAVFFGGCLAACDGVVYLFQVQESECRTDFVHFAVDAWCDYCCFISKTKVF